MSLSHPARLMIAGAALATPCFTQAATAQTAPAPTSASTTAQTTETADARPSWITVTGRREGYAAPNAASATRTDTPLIETPQSVQVITRTLIQEQDRRTLADALVNVSGVTGTRPEELLFASPIIRGFAAEIYQDGLPFYGATQAANDPNSLAGVERIDVVKGPVSTLYAGGVGTPLGGLINVATVRPNDRAGGFVAVRGGSFGTIDPFADLNLPLGRGVGVRITGEYQHNGSHIDRVEANRWSIQPGILFGMGARTTLFVQGKFDRRSQLEYSGIPAAAALAGQIGRNAFPGAPNGQPRTVVVNNLGTAELRHRFSDDLTLTVSGRYYAGRTREYGSFVSPIPAPSRPIRRRRRCIRSWRSSSPTG